MSHDHVHGEPCDHAHGPHPILTELRHHLPFSVGAVAIALVVLAIANVGLKVSDASMMQLFHVCHPLHLLVAATATTGMFYLYEHKVMKAVLIGILGSAPVCSLADIAFPFLGGLLLGTKMELHICALEEPWLVWPCVAVGVATGIAGASFLKRITLYSHSAHVFVSSFASAIYLISFGLKDWTSQFGWVLLIVLVAVMVPCCLSDIIFPLLFTKHRQRRSATANDVEDILHRRH